MRCAPQGESSCCGSGNSLWGAVLPPQSSRTWPTQRDWGHRSHDEASVGSGDTAEYLPTSLEEEGGDESSEEEEGGDMAQREMSVQTEVSIPMNVLCWASGGRGNGQFMMRHWKAGF